MVRIETERIQLIVYDFDGVMTDNKVYIDQYGNEFVKVNRADGLGVSRLAKMGFNQIILSTEKNSVVQKRAVKLGIHCIRGIDEKIRELKTYCKNNEISLKNILYLGNDVNDMEAMKAVGWPLCPSDAHESIKDVSKIILSKRGGEGVVRELMDLISLEG